MTSRSIELHKKAARLAKWLAAHDVAWTLLDPISRVFRLLRAQRQEVVSERLLLRWGCDKLIDSRKVLHGPFRELEFPRVEASQLAPIYPKILGCYERELHPIIESIRHKNYHRILDIGCAEGYYVAGFAQLFPESIVHAYDIDPTALALCQRMIEINGLTERVRLSSSCTQDDLASFEFQDPSLILCDCEGYEANLFTEETVKNLKTCDLIVEVHDFLDINISDQIKKLFEPTHVVTRVGTLDDLQKAHHYRYSETDHFPLEVKKCLFSENRGQYMEWLFIQPKPD